MGRQDEVRKRFERWLERYVADGEAPDAATLCADAPDLQPAVESLIARYRAIDEVLPSPTQTSDPSSPLAPSEPPVVANYRVVGLLGAGGMGEAWEAEQQSPVQRQVALKVIRRGTSTQHVLSRFATERQALAAMEHPAIAKVFDAGVTEDGRPYYAMELVRGEPIDRFADRHRLTLRQRLELLAEVCDGVQHAHQKGLIHRDLKPSNVLVAMRDHGSAEMPSGHRTIEPKIIDFGIAKAIALPAGDQETLTLLGQVVGTPAYMSPEQADLSGVDIDTRSDVYALGIMLYELLVGERPFEDSAFSGPNRTEDPLPPSVKLAKLGVRGDAIATRRSTQVSSLVRQLRGDIDWIVLKALVPDREKRYGSPAALADDLRRTFRDEPVSAGPPSAAYRLKKLARRHRVAVAAVFLVIFAAAATLAGLGLGLQRALRAEAQASAESEVARRVSEFLVDAFEAGDPSLQGEQVTARDVIDQAATRIRQQLVDEPEIRARLNGVLADASLNLGTLEQAGTLAADAVQMWSSTRGADDPQTYQARRRAAYIKMTAGELDAAEAEFRALLDAESSLRPGSLLEAKTANDLGILLGLREAHEEGEVLLRRALAIYRAEGLERDREAVRTLNNLASARRHQGATEEAVAMFREVLALQREILPSPNVDIATALNNLASAIRATGDLEEAESLYREALEQRRAVLGEDHPDVAQSLNNVGSARYWAGDYDTARDYWVQAFAVWQAAYGGDHPRLCAALSNLGAVSRRGGRFDQAEDYYQRAMEMETRLHGPDSVRVAMALRRLGETHLLDERPEDAIPTLERSLTIYLNEMGYGHDQAVTISLSLATAYRASGRDGEAERILARAEAAVADRPELANRIREARDVSS